MSEAQPKYPSTLAPPGLLARTLPVLEPILNPYFSLPTTHRVLELASGEGAHLVHFTTVHSNLTATPTECDQWAVEGIKSAVSHLNPTVSARINPAQVLDVLQTQDWDQLQELVKVQGTYEVAWGINFLHMVPLSVFSLLSTLASFCHDCMRLYYVLARGDSG